MSVPAFFLNDTPPTEIYTLSLHDALPISALGPSRRGRLQTGRRKQAAMLQWRVSSESPCRYRAQHRSEEHTSELQSRRDLVCRLLLEKKKQHSFTLVYPRQGRSGTPADRL